jgi:signal peptidase I
MKRRTFVFLLAAAVATALVAGCGKSTSTQKTGGLTVLNVSVPRTTETYLVASSAMEPTLHCASGQGCEASIPDRVEVATPAANLKRGDVIVFKTPPQAKVRCGAGGIFIKRLIGLPGETWSEWNGYVYMNGKKLNEPYIKPDRRDNETHTSEKIPNGTSFVMGDNRAESRDSRVWGTVPVANIIGQVTKVLRPK